MKSWILFHFVGADMCDEGKVAGRAGDPGGVTIPVSMGDGSTGLLHGGNIYVIAKAMQYFPLFGVEMT